MEIMFKHLTCSQNLLFEKNNYSGKKFSLAIWMNINCFSWLIKQVLSHIILIKNWESFTCKINSLIINKFKIKSKSIKRLFINQLNLTSII